jgi:hypothetical protein
VDDVVQVAIPETASLSVLAAVMTGQSLTCWSMPELR